MRSECSVRCTNEELGAGRLRSAYKLAIVPFQYLKTNPSSSNRSTSMQSLPLQSGRYSSFQASCRFQWDPKPQKLVKVGGHSSMLRLDHYLSRGSVSTENGRLLEKSMFNVAVFMNWKETYSTLRNKWHICRSWLFSTCSQEELPVQ